MRPRLPFVAEASAVGLLFPVSLLAGYWLGGTVGQWLRLRVDLSLIGAGLGIVAAFANLFRFARRLEKQEKWDDG